MSAPSKQSLSMDNGVCHLLVVSYSIDATLELTTRFLLSSWVCRWRPTRWKGAWRRLCCRKWRGSSSSLELGAPPLVFQARHRTCKTCFDTRRNMNPEPHFLILFFKNRMRKTSIRVPGSNDLFLSRNRSCLCTSVVAAYKWDFEHVYKVLGLVFLQHTKKRDVRTVRTEDMWAGIKWAGGSGREMGVEGQARSGRAVWRFLAAAATGHQCALVVLGLY